MFGLRRVKSVPARGCPLSSQGPPIGRRRGTFRPSALKALCYVDMSFLGFPCARDQTQGLPHVAWVIPYRILGPASVSVLRASSRRGRNKFPFPLGLHSQCFPANPPPSAQFWRILGFLIYLCWLSFLPISLVFSLLFFPASFFF